MVALTLDSIADEFWEALKEQCCGDPQNAKRCIMVSYTDVTTAFQKILLTYKENLNEVG